MEHLHGLHCSSAKSTSLVVATCNPSTREPKMGEVLQIKGSYELHSEYQRLSSETQNYQEINHKMYSTLISTLILQKSETVNMA